MKRIAFAAIAIALACVNVGLGREWKDSTGKFSVAGTLIAFDDHEIILKLDHPEKGRDLLAFPLKELSDADKLYLQSPEVARLLNDANQKQTWKMKSGVSVIAKVADFVRKDITIQRRRGKIYVNDRVYENLPEIYRKMLPKVIDHFEGTSLGNEKGFEEWVLKLKGAPKSFTCEGVILEFPNGDEYAVPFFFFSDEDLAVLKPSWDKWMQSMSATDTRTEEQRQHSLYLQSQAAAYQQSVQLQKQQMEIARLQLQLQAVNAGVVDMWEVYLYPNPGTFGYPTSVVVAARNSDDAYKIALQNNPGYQRGPIRKVAGF